MKLPRRHSVDSSLFKLSNIEASTLESPSEEASPPQPSSGRPRVQRRHSLTSVVSLGLVAGSSAFTTPQAAAPASGSSGRSQMTRSMSDQTLLAGQSVSAGNRPQMARKSQSDRGLITSSMLPLDAAMDVASSASQAASFLGDSPFAEVPNILSSKISTTELVAGALFGVGRSVVEDNKVKSELLTDFSHIAGDLVGFVTPNQTTLKVGMVVGRIFSIMADYLPDQMIQPEEAVFQACMLGVSTSLLYKHVKPIITAQLEPTSFRDKRAYQGLFRQFGLSWIQFKSLTAAAADWVELAPGEEIGVGDENGENDGDYFYWTYKGEADLLKNGDCVVQQGHKDLGLLGEVDIARKLQQRNRRRNSNTDNRNKLSKDDQNTSKVSTPSKVRAGPSGAKLLRINSTKLFELMDHDEQLADSINDMILTGMQEKLSSMYLEAAVGY